MSTSPIILVADDEPWQRLWITQVLHGAGFMCSTVADGSSVVEQALAMMPGLVVLDIQLPGLNGIEAAQQLRILPNTRTLPILFITSHAHNASMLDRTNIPHSDLLMKPFHPDELVRRAHRLINGAR